MSYLPRLLQNTIAAALARGKSVLLLGARQTGKTTLIAQQLKPALSYSFASVLTRQRYEANTALFEQELTARLTDAESRPLICLDEVQKLPAILDSVQHLIDNRLAQFILTGSSARKLRHGRNINLLPGRVVVLYLTPLLCSELPATTTLEELLIYGSLPDIVLQPERAHKESDLQSYVATYLEEEVRAEALVRNVGHFSRFLQIAAGEAGNIINFSRLSQDIGVADQTIVNYFQILEDCLIVHKIDPITQSYTKRRLIKSPKYLFFDLGVRRVCAGEGAQLSSTAVGMLFEQFVGTELWRLAQFQTEPVYLRYWHDTRGIEVDFVLERAKQYIPIEVKYSEQPAINAIKHLLKFLDEYPNVGQGYVVCRTPHAYRLHEKIIALPWQALPEIFATPIKK